MLAIDDIESCGWTRAEAVQLHRHLSSHAGVFDFNYLESWARQVRRGPTSRPRLSPLIPVIHSSNSQAAYIASRQAAAVSRLTDIANIAQGSNAPPRPPMEPIVVRLPPVTQPSTTNQPQTTPPAPGEPGTPAQAQEQAPSSSSIPDSLPAEILSSTPNSNDEEAEEAEEAEEVDDQTRREQRRQRNQEML